MIPIYFPFTIISDPVYRLMDFFFEGVVLYQPGDTEIPKPMRKLVSDGMVALRVPEKNMAGELESARAAFIDFAGLHGGNTGSVFGANQGQVPFFSDESVSSLRERIKSDRNGSPETGDSLFRARLFLLLAQEYDRQNESVHMDLGRIAGMEADLLADIREPDTLEKDHGLFPGRPPADHDREYMIPERVMAWSKLALRDTSRPDFFLTSSGDAFENFIEAAGQIETLLEIKSVSPVSPNPIMKTALGAFVQDALEGKTPDRQGLEKIIAGAGENESGRGIDFVATIVRISGGSGKEYLRHLSENDGHRVLLPQQTDSSQNLVVAKVIKSV